MLTNYELCQVLKSHILTFSLETNDSVTRRLVEREITELAEVLIRANVLESELDYNAIKVMCNEENNRPNIIDDGKIVFDINIAGLSHSIGFSKQFTLSPAHVSIA